MAKPKGRKVNYGEKKKKGLNDDLIEEISEEEEYDSKDPDEDDD